MTGDESQLPEHPGLRAHWAVAAGPVLLVVAGVLGGMHLDASQAPAVVAARAEHGFFARLYWTQVFSHADGPKVMFLSALAGSVLAAVLALTRREEASPRRPLGLVKVCKTWTSGITGFSYALVILILAWAIKETCEAVETSAYIVGAISRLPRPALPPPPRIPARRSGSLLHRHLVDDHGRTLADYDPGSLRLGRSGADGPRRRCGLGRRDLRRPLLPHQRHHGPLQHCRGLRPT